jgi:hypothetical protein
LLQNNFRTSELQQLPQPPKNKRPTSGFLSSSSPVPEIAV